LKKLELVYAAVDVWIGFGGGGNQGEKYIPYWFGFDES
jgi:hypothetical protein